MMSALDTALSQGGAAADGRRAKILVVEDDAEFRFALEAALADVGYEYEIVANGDDALRTLYAFQPDLVLLDIRLPGMNGMDLCERIRIMSDVPVIIFSALGDKDEKLAAFAKGADDYVVKDTSIDELLARIAVGLRRARSAPAEQPHDVYSDTEIEIDFARYSVKVRGESVELTPTEYKILSILVKRVGQPIPPDQLLRKVWGPEYTTEDLVKWHVGHLRRKIERDPERPALVITRRGFGYLYVPPTNSSRKSAAA